MKAIVLLLAAALWCGSAGAAMPQTLNYQGYLTTPGGTPINTSVVVTLKLYDAATAGTLKWSEIQPSVAVTNGIFNVVLGSATPLPPLAFDAPYWLTVTINADGEMSPRQPVTASAYAIRSANADALAPAATVAGAQITGSISSATLPVGNLGGPIGTAQIAGNAVTQAKLSPVSGAAAGKVLGTDGSNLQWVTAGAGSVTSVGTGSGLTGGPITGSGSIGLAATQLLPAASCATNQIAKWTGSAWACAADDNAPAGGTTGQVLIGTAGAPAWSGSPTLSGNLILPVTGGASAGTIMKAGTRFIHYAGFSNTFIGEGAGNFTMSGSNNTGSGVQALLSNTSGGYNTAAGSNVLFNNTTGTANTAVGSSALQSNTTGINNTASGANALQSNMTGSGNSAHGLGALQNSGKISTAGSFVPGSPYTIQTLGTTNFTLIGAAANTVGTTFTASGVGAGTGTASANADHNTATGYSALFANTTGVENVATGYQALYSNMGGSANTASGTNALQSNMVGNGNTAHGYGALQNSGKTITAGSFVVGVDYVIQTLGTTSFTLIGAATNTVGTSFQATGVGAGTGTASPIADDNTATGKYALFSNTSGSANVGTGPQALWGNTTGSLNVAVGNSALNNNVTGNYNTGVGAFALLQGGGSSNTAIGYAAGQNLTTGSYNIAIGNVGVAGEANTIRIGAAPNQTRTFIAGINGAFIASGNNVFIDSNGQLGTSPSSGRYKDDIADMDATSSALMKLRPVTFHYKSDRNPAGRTLQYGLIAEEVDKVYPGLVAHAADGRIETVMYQFLPPMLLNEFQKQQRTIEAQAARIEALERQAADIAMLKQQLALVQAALPSPGRPEAARLARVR